MLLIHVEFRKLNVLSAIALTNPSIINTLLGVVKPIIKPTLLNLKPRKANYIHICSSTPTAEETIKWTQTHVPSGSIDLTVTGITRNNRNFVKTGVT